MEKYFKTYFYLLYRFSKLRLLDLLIKLVLISSIILTNAKPKYCFRFRYISARKQVCVHTAAVAMSRLQLKFFNLFRHEVRIISLSNFDFRSLKFSPRCDFSAVLAKFCGITFLFFTEFLKLSILELSAKEKNTIQK